MSKPYDRNNNDTYVEILSMSPASDVEAHMFCDPNGRVSAHGRLGNFSTESRKKAENNVLHFSKASSLGLTLIKSLRLYTPLPMSLVLRYARKADSLMYAQNTPVFFDSKREKFVLLLDMRFLRDIQYSELKPLLQGDAIKSITTYTDKDGQAHLGILYETLDQLRRDNEEAEAAVGRFKSLKHAFQDYVLLLEQGEKVIILRFICKNDKINFLKVSGGNDMTHGVHVSDMHMEMAIAFKFGLRYYLSKDGETFSQSDVINIDKERFQGEYVDPFTGNQSLQNYQRKDDNPGLLILPYSDDQYRLIKGMHDRLHGLNRELNDFFNSFVDATSGVDMPITPARIASMSSALKGLAHD